jgi:hypothetical protein
MNLVCRGAGWGRGLAAIVAILTVVAVRLPAAGQEPPDLTGKWIGTWWMGKYEEPVELDLVQTAGDLSGKISVWGYPALEQGRRGSSVDGVVSGTVEGRRAHFTWITADNRRGDVELTLSDRGTLSGRGADSGGIRTGFELMRAR